MSDSTRRTFLAAAAGAAWTARSYAAIIGSNDRLRLGIIGCGGMATAGHMRPLTRQKEALNLEFNSVCDLFDKRTDSAAQLTGAPNKFREYRKLLDNKDVDYVLIATPEHWHAQISIDAAAAGKHIYCEKPMTWNVDQAKKVVAAIHTAKDIKMQVGVQGMSDDSFENANKYLKDGTLGKVVLAQIDYSRNSIEPDYLNTPADPDIKPGINFDWNTWLGRAPKRPFDPGRYFNWRRYWDYSSGIASDLFIHRVTRIIKSLGLTFPLRGAATGGKFGWPDAAGEVPDTMNILLDYPEGLTVQLVSSMANDSTIEHMLRGHKATLTFDREGFVIKPQRAFAKDMQEVVFKKTGAENTVLHHQNLHNAIRLGEALRCPVELGYYGVVASQIGVQSLRRQQYMRWDRNKERIVKA